MGGMRRLLKLSAVLSAAASGVVVALAVWARREPEWVLPPRSTAEVSPEEWSDEPSLYAYVASR